MSFLFCFTVIDIATRVVPQLTKKLTDPATHGLTDQNRGPGAGFSAAPGWAGARLLRLVDAKRKGNRNTVRHSRLETHGLRVARLSFLPVVWSGAATNDQAQKFSELDLA